LVIDLVRIARHPFGQFQGRLLRIAEVITIVKVGKVADLVFRVPMPALPRWCVRPVNIRIG
jgi:hypothetical protein